MIPTYADWMKATAAGILKSRSAELKEIDLRIKRYHSATSEYGKEWEANEVRITLDAWKKAEGGKWKTSERNKTKAFENLDAELPPARAGLGAASDGQNASNLRKGALYFLASSTTLKIPADPQALVNDAIDAGSDVHNLIVTGEADSRKWKMTPESLKGKDESGFLKSIYESIKDYIGQLIEACGGEDSAREAAAFILSKLGDILLQLLGSVLKQATAALDVLKNLGQATKAAIAAYRAEDYGSAILSGHPQAVVKAVYGQIVKARTKALKDAAKAALSGGLSLANPVIGTVVNAIASAYAFVKDLFERFRDLRRFNKVIADAKTQLQLHLYEQPARFQEWFLGVIKDLPIVSCYCMTMPMTGSYYGFLTLVSTDGTQMTYKQLERNYRMFQDIKQWAFKFIADNKIKIDSADPMVKHSIWVARGGKGTWDNQKQSVIKQGMAARCGKAFLGVVEQAAGG